MQRFKISRKLMAFLLTICMIVSVVSNQYLLVRAEESVMSIAELKDSAYEVKADEINNGMITLTKQMGDYTWSNSNGDYTFTGTYGNLIKIAVPANTEYGLVTTDGVFYLYDADIKKLISSSNLSNMCEVTNNTDNEAVYYVWLIMNDSEDEPKFKIQTPQKIGDMKEEAYEVKEEDINNGEISLTKQIGYYTYPNDDGEYEMGSSRGNLIKITVPANTSYALNTNQGNFFTYNNDIGKELSFGSLVVISNDTDAQAVYYAWFQTYTYDHIPKFEVNSCIRIADIKDNAYEVTEEDINNGEISLMEQTGYYAWPDSNGDYTFVATYGNLIKITVPANTIYDVDVGSPQGSYIYDTDMDKMLSKGCIVNNTDNEATYYVWFRGFLSGSGNIQFEINEADKINTIKDSAYEVTEEDIKSGTVTLNTRDDYYSFPDTDGQYTNTSTHGNLIKIIVPANTSYRLHGLSFSFSVYDSDIERCLVDALRYTIENDTDREEIYYVWSDDPFGSSDTVSLEIGEIKRIVDIKDSAYEVTADDMNHTIPFNAQEGYYTFPDYQGEYSNFSEWGSMLLKITIPAYMGYTVKSSESLHLYSYNANIDVCLSDGDCINIDNNTNVDRVYYVWANIANSLDTPSISISSYQIPVDISKLESLATEITEDRTEVDMNKVHTIKIYSQDRYDEEGNPIYCYDETGVLYKYKIPARTEAAFSLEATGFNSNSRLAVYKDLNENCEYMYNSYTLDNYTNSISSEWIYIWVAIYDSTSPITIVKEEKATEEYNFTTPYDEEVNSLYEKDELQDVYLYAWNNEAYGIVKAFYGSHPEYADKVHCINLSMSATSDEYMNSVDDKLSGNESVIATFDGGLSDNKLENSNITALDKIGVLNGKSLADYYTANAYVCSFADASYDDELKMVSSYVCPGMFMYNKDIAKAVLGTDDPEEVQKYICDWDSFMETAQAAKEKGYYITSGSKYILEELCVQPEKYSALLEAGYETGHTMYSGDWYNDINDNNTVFGFFATTWLGWIFNESELEKYDFCASPSSYLWGGIYFAANPACANNPLAAQVLYLMTCDTDAMVKYGSDGHNCLVNNKAAVKILEEKNVPLMYTGVLSSLWSRWDAYAKQVGNENNAIDKLSVKKDSAVKIYDDEYVTNKNSVYTVSIPLYNPDNSTIEYKKSTGKLYSFTLMAKSKLTVTDSRGDTIYVYGDNGLDEAPIVYGDGSVELSNLANESKTYYLWVSGDNNGITINKKVTPMDNSEDVTDNGKKVDTIVDTTDKGTSITVSENKDDNDTIKNASVKVSITDVTDSDDAIDKCVEVITQYNSDNEGNAQIDKIEVIYSGNESVTVSEITINSLKKLQGNVSLEVSKKSEEDTDKIIYTWKFKPTLADTVYAVNTGIDIYENAEGYENKTEIDDMLAETATKCVLAFEHDGILPENTEITVDVSDQYTNGTKLYYYHIDDNKLEEIGTTVVENGYATLQLSHCSDYVMSDKAVCQHENTEIRGQKSADCKTAGYTGDTYCKECGKKLSSGTTITKKDHVAGQWIVDREATEDAEGSMHTECTACKTVLETKKIDKLPASVQDPTLSPITDATVTSSGVYVASHTKDTIAVGLVAEASKTADLEYRWLVCDTSVDSDKWIEIQGWTKNNEWLTWKPGKTGDYVIVGQVRVVGNEESQAQSSVGIPHHEQIKGKCQMPYTGEGGGYLIGIETYDNPNQEYTYELLVLDCTLLAEGKDAWIWSTGRCSVPETSFWAVWQPQYGYYWTLFRVYDKDGNLKDQECYGFVNAY